MNRTSTLLATALVSLILGASGSTRAEVAVDLGIKEIYTNNLRKDSSDYEDWFTTRSASLKVYPLSTVEVTFGYDDAVYRKSNELNSVGGQLSIGFVPTSERSILSIYLESRLDLRHYHEDSRDNNNRGIHLSAVTDLHPSSWPISLRGGMIFSSSKYPHSDDLDKETIDLVGGLNWVFLGRNTLDIEAGASFASATFLDTLGRDKDNERVVIFNHPYDLTIPDRMDGNLRMFSISPRYSRPIDFLQSGLNVLYSYQKICNIRHRFIQRPSQESLSPWVSVWKGWSIGFELKSYLVPRMIVTTGSTYWDKEYYSTLGVNEFSAWSSDIVRLDLKRRTFLTLERPVIISTDRVLKPTLTVDYTNNTSADPRYTYTDWSVTLGLSTTL